MVRPPHTMRELKMSAADSTASAMSAYVFPAMPATSLAATRSALVISPVCAARMPRRESISSIGSGQGLGWSRCNATAVDVNRLLDRVDQALQVHGDHGRTTTTSRA